MVEMDLVGHHVRNEIQKKNLLALTIIPRLSFRGLPISLESNNETRTVGFQQGRVDDSSLFEPSTGAHSSMTDGHTQQQGQ